MIGENAVISASQGKIIFLKGITDDPFIALYEKLQRHEGRQYSDKELRSLPFIDEHSPLYHEWQLRLLSSMKLYQYLLHKNRPLKILEYGCGNGWLANMLTEVNGSEVWAADINLNALQQGSRVFSDNKNLHFTFFDMQEDETPYEDFDVILFANTLQYLSNIHEVIDRSTRWLRPDGEIHILDSPVLPAKKIGKGVETSKIYFETAGFPDMATYYHHHSLEDLKKFNAEILYDPEGLLNKASRSILEEADSPFPWILIKKQKNGI